MTTPTLADIAMIDQWNNAVAYLRHNAILMNKLTTFNVPIMYISPTMVKYDQALKSIFKSPAGLLAVMKRFGHKGIYKIEKKGAIRRYRIMGTIHVRQPEEEEKPKALYIDYPFVK